MNILATENHPLYHSLKSRVVSKVADEESLVIDLTLTDPEQKKQTLANLKGHRVISDLTCYRGEELVQSYPHICGALGAGFPSPRNSCEAWANDDRVWNTIEHFLQELGMDVLRTPTPGTGFTYPRVLSMIINEAWLALEDKLADRDNIDLAMKNGVNYPWGPFEWGEKIGLNKIKMLLSELHRQTGNERYRPCSLLQHQAQ